MRRLPSAATSCRRIVRSTPATAPRSFVAGFVASLCPQIAALVLEPFALAALSPLFFHARPIEIDDQAERQESDGFDGKEFGQADWNVLAHACRGLWSGPGRMASL